MAGRPPSKDKIKDIADRAEGLKQGLKPEPEAKIGRPPKFQDTFIKQAEKLCVLGATNADLADFFEVSIRTIERWCVEHEGFCRAVKEAKDTADARVERSLYQRAVGYSFDSEKVQVLRDGEVVRVPTRDHCPPDTTAQIFWLKNRKPEQWREKVLNEHTGKDGGPIQTEDVSARDTLARRIAGIAAREPEARTDRKPH